MRNSTSCWITWQDGVINIHYVSQKRLIKIDIIMQKGGSDISECVSRGLYNTEKT